MVQLPHPLKSTGALWQRSTAWISSQVWLQRLGLRGTIGGEYLACLEAAQGPEQEPERRGRGSKAHNDAHRGGDLRSPDLFVLLFNIIYI